MVGSPLENRCMASEDGFHLDNKDLKENLVNGASDEDYEKQVAGSELSR